MKMKKRTYICLCAVCVAIIVAGCARTVSFSSGRFKSDETELQLTITDGETALLNEFPDLTKVDLTGSTNYGEIKAWADANQNVRVDYAVIFPDGTQVDPKTETLDISGMSRDNLEEIKNLLAYLPSLETVNMGSEDGSFTLADLQELKAAHPAIEFIYDFKLGGKHCSLDSTAVDLTGITSADVDRTVELLKLMPNVQSVLLPSGDKVLSYDDMTKIGNACPDAVLDCDLDVYGEAVNLSDDSLIISHIALDDNGALVWQVLPLMRNCTLLDMDSCGVGDEDMAAIRDAFPDVKVVWRIWWGWLYSVRTDVETILCSNPYKGGFLTPDQCTPLQYCTDVKNMDAGHDAELTDISFLQYMPKMETLILYGAGFSDASPLSSLKNLTYLEVADNPALTDISPIGECTNLEHLNIALCTGVTDISGLYPLTNLKRLWIGVDVNLHLPDGQVEHIQKLNPNCEINLDCYNPVDGRWRYEIMDGPNGSILCEPYERIREIFGYSWDIENDDSMFSYYYNDPLYNSRISQE